MAAEQTAAPVPSIATGLPSGRESEFSHLNKQLRACLVCKLIKSQPQWLDEASSGCENCGWKIDASKDFTMEVLDQHTTANFSGMMTLMEPSMSWVAKWTHTSKCVPGCYALSINEEVPRDLLQEHRNRGGRY